MNFLQDKKRVENQEDCQSQQNRLESVNNIVLRFSLIFYFVLLGGTLLQYVFMQHRVLDYIFFWGIVGAILSQVLFFCKFRKSCCYGRATMLLFSIVFTYANIISADNMVLLLAIPISALYILYMNKVYLNVIYCVWIGNAAIRFATLIRNSGTSLDVYRAFAWVVMVCMVYGVALYMVNQSVSHHYEDVCHSLSHENKLHKLLYKQSTIDTTTGLCNRNAYNEYLAEYKSDRLSSISCIYIDVNGLHEYNNAYGHQAGDKMLKKVAQAMKKCFGSHKQYRIGGDEFVTISEDMTFKAVLNDLKQFRDTMKSQHIYIASGMEWRDENMNLSDMIKKADAKMYQDKERFYKEFPEGRGSSSIYEKVLE